MYFRWHHSPSSIFGAFLACFVVSYWPGILLAIFLMLVFITTPVVTFNYFYWQIFPPVEGSYDAYSDFNQAKESVREFWFHMKFLAISFACIVGFVLWTLPEVLRQLSKEIDNKETARAEAKRTGKETWELAEEDWAAQKEATKAANL